MRTRRIFTNQSSPKTPQRIQILQLSIYAFFLAVISRLFYWQIIKGKELQAIAETQYERTTQFNAKRGRISTADGHILVGNATQYTLFGQPKIISESPTSIAKILAPLVISDDEFPEATESARREEIVHDFEKVFSEKLSQSDKNWVSLKQRVTEEQKETISQANILGIGFDPQSARMYPENELGAQIVGFVGKNEQGEDKGYFGIEGKFDLELQGKNGVLHRSTDALGLPILLDDDDLISVEEGRDITLTIRREIQYLLEEKLQAGLKKYGAISGEVVVMNPKTGDILGMASFPTYSPRMFFRYDPELYKNPLVAESYEPGSTFKILTVSAGIDAGVINSETQCTRCSGPRSIGGYTIRTWNDTYTPNITISEGLAKSDNTAMIFVAEELGQEKFIEYLKKFKIGEPSGIELQEDAGSIFREDWKPIDLATSSFGQGISVTGMQMMRATSAIANGGTMMRPKIIKSVTVRGEEIPVEPEEVGHPISTQTARIVTDMMVNAAQHGEAQWTASKRYTIAGKTGTAQIPVAGHYDEDKTIASFIGFAPASDPQFIMLVKLREPSSSPWASETAAPLWYDIAKDLFIHLNILPDRE